MPNEEEKIKELKDALLKVKQEKQKESTEIENEELRKIAETLSERSKKILRERYLSISGSEKTAKGELELGDLINGLRVLARSFKERFCLEDLFTIFDWCIDGDYDLRSAIQATIQKRREFVYLLVKANGDYLGAFNYKGLAEHYVKQYTNVGQIVTLVQVPIADGMKPVKQEDGSYIFV